MTAPASLEDFPHIAQAHMDGRIRVASRKDTGVIARTVALSLAALVAPVIAGSIVGFTTRGGAADEQVREAPFALAVTAAPATSTIR